MYDFLPFKNKVREIEEWLKKECSAIRTGRATPVILDGITVSAYGSSMSVKELANISTEDAKTIRITPWDASVSKSIEKAIIDSGLGLSVVVDDKGLRVIFPELTSERRQSLVKVLKQKLEEARVSLRMERDKVKGEIESKFKTGTLGEDEKFRFLDEMQKLIDDGNSQLNNVSERKEKEILA